MTHRLFLILLIVIGFAFSVVAQEMFRVSGKVIDASTKEPLPFVNIVINDGNQGGATDIDGKFMLLNRTPVRTLKLSFVGYETRQVKVGEKTRDLTIQMTRREIDLQEVEILPGVNPAHRIIRNIMENREINDPEKVKTFSYTAYDKTIFTLDTMTTSGNEFGALVDTSSQEGPVMVKLDMGDADTSQAAKMKRDSAYMEMEKMLSEQYLFLMENVTKRKFMAPDRNYNQVIATKVSGFKDPIFVFLATQMQSFSFYKPFISIVMKDYVNPIRAGSLSKYFYKIEDTAYAGKDTVFIISFRPMKKTNFNGLKGVMAVSSNRWAIRNVTAEPADDKGGYRIRIHQMYEFIDSLQWFPVQLNTDLSFRNMQVGKYKPVGRGRSYIKDIVLNPELVRREFNHLDIEVDQQASTRTEEFWNQYRIDSLTPKDQRTYQVIDSIGEAQNFDQQAKKFQSLMTGRIPWGPIDLDINRFLNYNTYEGIVAGAGIHTNDRLSDWFRLGGYFQYAFAVQQPKFGADVRFLLNKRNDFSIQAYYINDLTESGGVAFPSENKSILTGDFRQLMIRKLDMTRKLSVSTTYRWKKYLLLNLGLNVSYKESTTDDFAIQEGNVVMLENTFRFTNVTAGFKWAYGEKFIQTTREKISMGTRYPVVWFQYSVGLKGFLDGEYAYNRFDLKINKTFKFQYIGNLSAQLSGGYIDKPIPACELYYAPSSYRPFTLFASGSFTTMRSNEFLSSSYASLFLYHDFRNLLFKGTRWFHPGFAISQNLGFGWLDHKEHYSYISIQPREMNLGYFESGVLVNNLLDMRFYTLGLGLFYRWGPYSFDAAGDNLAYKFTMVFKM